MNNVNISAVAERLQQVLRTEYTKKVRAVTRIRLKILSTLIIDVAWRLRVQDDVVIRLDIHHLHSLGESLERWQRQVLVRIDSAHVREHALVRLHGLWHLLLRHMLLSWVVQVRTASLISDYRLLAFYIELTVHLHEAM